MKPPEPRGGERATRDGVLASLRGLATAHTRDGMARYGLPADKALGVAVGDLRRLAATIGHDPGLADALWDTDVYEARLLAAFVDDPARVTPAQMDRWMGDVDNWGLCDTLCFHLFDRTPHAFGRVAAWADRPETFVKRGAFALLASLALHDESAADEAFLASLPRIVRGADDGRNFVKKGVSWALRGIGHRNAALHAAAVALARELAASPSAAPRWVGKDALRDLTRDAVVARVARSRR